MLINYKFTEHGKEMFIKYQAQIENNKKKFAWLELCTNSTWWSIVRNVKLHALTIHEETVKHYNIYFSLSNIVMLAIFALWIIKLRSKIKLDFYSCV